MSECAKCRLSKQLQFVLNRLFYSLEFHIPSLHILGLELTLETNEQNEPVYKPPDAQ